MLAAGASPPAASRCSSAWRPARRVRRRLGRLPGRPHGPGLPSPLLVISDGAPGLIAAIEQAFPKALRQRCLIHRARNMLAKVPAGMQAEVKDAYWAMFDTGDLKTPPGPGLVADRRQPGSTAIAGRYAASTRPRSSACSPTAKG